MSAISSAAAQNFLVPYQQEELTPEELAARRELEEARKRDERERKAEKILAKVDHKCCKIEKKARNVQAKANRKCTRIQKEVDSIQTKADLKHSRVRTKADKKRRKLGVD